MCRHAHCLARVMRAVTWPVIVITLLHCLNAALAGAQVLPNVALGISVLGLIGVPWMAISVLRDTSAGAARALGEHEWGYQDRPDIKPRR